MQLWLLRPKDAARDKALWTSQRSEAQKTLTQIKNARKVQTRYSTKDSLEEELFQPSSTKKWNEEGTELLSLYSEDKK